MSILTNNSQRFLVESMRKSLIDSVKNTKTLTESVVVESTKFINTKATYEQLLNMTMNPLRESKYLPTHVLEGAVAILSEAMFTGRQVIGPNAIAQGAINLSKKTDCVITESMLDAASNACNKNSLKVISEAIMMEADESYYKQVSNVKAAARNENKTLRTSVPGLKSEVKKAKAAYEANKTQANKDTLKAAKDKLNATLRKIERNKKFLGQSASGTKKVAQQAETVGSKVMSHLGRHKLAYGVGAAAALAGGALAAKKKLANDQQDA